MKEKTLKMLNGMSIGIVCSLVPKAMFGQLLTAFGITFVVPYLDFFTTLMCLMMGVCIARQFKLDNINTCALTIATMIGGGSFKGINADGFMTIKGSGDIINASIGAIVALVIILNLSKRIGAFQLLVIPSLCVVTSTLVCNFTADPISQITNTIGMIIANFTTLQPLLMSMLIGLSFAIIIISPISSVAIALLININGIGSAAANIGICALSTCLALLSLKENGIGTSLVAYLGSPKIQMANFLKNPIMALPCLISAIICPMLVPFFQLQGTPMSAGFGSSGLIGPLANLGAKGYTLDNWIISIACYIVIPFIVSYIMIKIFRDKLNIVNHEMYKLDFD